MSANRRDDDADELPRLVLERRALSGLDAVYRKVDALLTGVGCAESAECCRFPGGREPYLLPVEWLRLKASLAKQGRAIPPPRPEGGCRLLDPSGKRCTVYADRPFGCRTFFCERIRSPRPVSNEGLNALTAKLTAVADSLDEGAQPRRLWELLEEAYFQPGIVRKSIQQD